MTDVQAEVVELTDQVAFLFDEVASIDDVQQDNRVFVLEQETSG